MGTGCRRWGSGDTCCVDCDGPASGVERWTGGSIAAAASSFGGTVAYLHSESPHENEGTSWSSPPFRWAYTASRLGFQILTNACGQTTKSRCRPPCCRHRRNVHPAFFASESAPVTVRVRRGRQRSWDPGPGRGNAAVADRDRAVGRGNYRRPHHRRRWLVLSRQKRSASLRPQGHFCHLRRNSRVVLGYYVRTQTQFCLRFASACQHFCVARSHRPSRRLRPYWWFASGQH